MQLIKAESEEELSEFLSQWWNGEREDPAKGLWTTANLCDCLVHFYIPETCNISVSVVISIVHVLKSEAFSSPSVGTELHKKPHDKM